MNITILPASPQQLDSIYELEKECFFRPWSLKELEYTCESENHLLLCAADDNQAVAGYGSCEYILDEGNIGNIAVATECRRQGTAKKIMEALIDYGIKSKGTKSFFLEVRSGNAAAIKLYEKIGFLQYSVRKNYYESANSAREDAIMMKLNIE